jgi:hypothetical protein
MFSADDCAEVSELVGRKMDQTPMSFALAVKVDFLLQNSGVLRVIQLSKLLPNNELRDDACRNSRRILRRTL